MKVTYRFPLSRPIKLDDHWPVPMLGGVARMIDEDGVVTAIQFEKAGCPTSLAFQIEETPNETSKATIHGKDGFVADVRDHLDRAFSFLQCHFSTSLEAESVHVTHEAENAEERELIVLPTFEIGRRVPRPLGITYDMITRALMAAEDGNAPSFEASLAELARKALEPKHFIESFRYSFLLMEAIYGEGQFKAKALTAAFASSSHFMAIVGRAIREWPPPKNAAVSPTTKLIASNPTPDAVAAHLVERRGHYFHANLKKPGAWSAKDQSEAEALAWLSIGIAQMIASEASSKMFKPEYADRHFAEARKMGAHVVMTIEYLFRVDEEDFLRRYEAAFRMPGTKVTTRMATDAAKNALLTFQNQMPGANLHSVSGKAPGGAVAFQIRIMTEPDGKIVQG